MQAINLKSFRKKMRLHKKGFRAFLTRLENNPPPKLDALASRVDKEVWQQVSCLSCANCCKTMSPTFNRADLKRISTHLGMTVAGFKERWLVYDKKDGDWMNKSQPCQFLDLTTHMCSIYDVRPDDCAGFPHLTKKRMTTYMHVHKQNIEYCPATYTMVEKMKHIRTIEKRLQ